MLYQRNLTIRFGRYFIWKHYQNLSFRILRNDDVFSLFLNRNSEVWQVARSMFRIVSGYFPQINSVIIHLVWLTSLSGIKVNIIQIWIRFFQIESGGLIKFIYRPVKHKYINVSFHRCCIILTRGSNCKSIIQATDLLEERAEDTYNHCLLQNIHCCTTKWLRQPGFNCEASLLLVTSFKLFNYLKVSTLSPTWVV